MPVETLYNKREIDIYVLVSQRTGQRLHRKGKTFVWKLGKESMVLQLSIF